MSARDLLVIVLYSLGFVVATCVVICVTALLWGVTVMVVRGVLAGSGSGGRRE